MLISFPVASMWFTLTQEFRFNILLSILFRVFAVLIILQPHFVPNVLEQFIDFFYCSKQIFDDKKNKNQSHQSIINTRNGYHHFLTWVSNAVNDPFCFFFFLTKSTKRCIDTNTRRTTLCMCFRTKTHASNRNES